MFLFAIRVPLALLGAALIAQPAAASASQSSAKHALSFVKAECPTPPTPIAALATARCGRLSVPENRAKKDGRTISLSVAIIRARSPNPKPDPIVWLAGGPGDDAITEIPWALNGDLNRDRDVIFISQRGTYSARPNSLCPTVDRAAAEALDMPFNSKPYAAVVERAQRACRDELIARGLDIAAYNDAESAADLEDARRALGYGKWNLFGISYGTDLALVTMRLFPDGIRAVGIDGIFPPWTGGAVSGWKAVEGIKAVFSECAAQPECNRRYPDLEGQFRRLVVQYERAPKTFEVQLPGRAEPARVKVDGGMLVQWLASPGTHLAGQVPAALDELARGKPDRMVRLWASSRLDPGGIGIIGQGLANTILCSQWVPFETEEEVVAAGSRLFPEFPRSMLANAPNNQFTREICRVWNVASAPPSIRDPLRSDIPTLIVNAQYDAQTPPSNGALVGRTLSNSLVVTIPNVAHVAFASPSPAANACAQQIVRDFFDDLLKVDTSCIARVPRTKFEILP